MLFRSPRERRLWLSAAGYTLLIDATLGVVRPVTEFLRDRGLLRPLIFLLFALAGGAVLLALVRLRPGLRQWLALAGVGVGYAAVLPFAIAPEEQIHLLEYGLLGGLIYEALRTRLRASGNPERRQRPLALRFPAATALALTTALGWIDEGIQYLLPNRYYDLRDVAFNAIAGGLAILAMAVLGERPGPAPAGRP